MKIRVKPSILTHNPVAHGGPYSVHNCDPDTIDFSSNVSPAGMPSSVKTALRQKLYTMENYPDLYSSDLMHGLKKYTKLAESNLLVGNGAIEIIYNFCNTFLSKKRVLIQAPTFGEYEAAARLAVCKISHFQSMNIAESLEAFIRKIPKNGCVFVCNPNNPTGTMLCKKQLARIIQAAGKKSCIVFVDECFIELVPDSDQSILNLVKKHDNLFVLRSLTKSFGLAGIRIGYAAASQQIISILQKTKIPWSVNALAQQAGLLAIKNKTHLKKSKSIIKKESNFLKNKINEFAEFECHDSVANFILVKTKQDSTKLQKKLLKHKILIRDCKNFQGLNNHYIRIAVRTHKDNLKLISALEKAA